jgi:hypothetical protein
MVATSSPAITAEQMRWFRLQRGGLVTPFASAEACAVAHFGIQAQILSAAGLALWNRTAGLTEQRCTELLHVERTLVKLWGQRNTLHLYSCADWPLLYAACSVNLTWWERQLDEADRARYEQLIAQVVELLRAHETIGRTDLRTADLALREDHFSSWGGIFADLVRRGYACHAGRVGNEGLFAHRERWVPDLLWDPPSADEANMAVMRRFFATYGPATLQDFAYWRSVTVGQARPWQAALQAELSTVEVAGQARLALRPDLEALTTPPPERSAWPVRMLYRFDPYLLAHKDKGWVADTAFYSRIWRPAGHIEGIVLVHGRAAATWRYDRKGRGLLITVTPFQKLPRSVLKAIEQIAPQIAAFFALPLVELVCEPIG